jgi:hypothetical protein
MLRVVAQIRIWLVGAALAFLRNDPIDNLPGLSPDWKHTSPYSLEKLFWTLSDAGKEEMVCRANGWPEALREQVRMAMMEPASTHPKTRWFNRFPWVYSYGRWRTNSGQIPQYGNFNIPMNDELCPWEAGGYRL